MHILRADIYLAAIEFRVEIGDDGQRSCRWIEADIAAGGAEAYVLCGNSFQDSRGEGMSLFRRSIHLPVTRDERDAVIRSRHFICSYNSRSVAGERPRPAIFRSIKARLRAFRSAFPSAAEFCPLMSATECRQTAYSICGEFFCQRHNAFRCVH